MTARIKFEPHSGNPGGTIESKMTYDREIGCILAEAQKLCDDLLQRHFLDSGACLPEIEVLRALQGQHTTIDDDLARIHIDGEQAELDRRRALATETGARLASSLTNIDKRRMELATRVEEVERGRKLFAAEVKAAETAALKAVEKHHAKAVGLAFEEIWKRAEEAHARLLAAEKLLSLIDDIAAIEEAKTRMLIEKSNSTDTAERNLIRVLEHAKKSESPAVSNDADPAA